MPWHDPETNENAQKPVLLSSWHVVRQQQMRKMEKEIYEQPHAERQWRWSEDWESGNASPRQDQHRDDGTTEEYNQWWDKKNIRLWVKAPLLCVLWGSKWLHIMLFGIDLPTQDFCYTGLSGRNCLAWFGCLHMILSVNANYTQQLSGN